MLAQTNTLFIARMGMRNHATSHYAEVSQSRGPWVLPDVYYIDFGSNRYREVGLGGGSDLLHFKFLNFTQEVYFAQTTGPAANGALYLVPWSYVGYALTSRLKGETVYFPYVPLNRAGRIQHVLERAKLEYYFKHFKVGAGYGGYKYGAGNWQQKPFLTTTVRGGDLGELEFWLQRLPGNHMQAQIRYKVSFKSGKKN